MPCLDNPSLAIRGFPLLTCLPLLLERSIQAATDVGANHADLYRDLLRGSSRVDQDVGSTLIDYSPLPGKDAEGEETPFRLLPPYGGVVNPARFVYRSFFGKGETTRLRLTLVPRVCSWFDRRHSTTTARVTSRENVKSAGDSKRSL